MISFKLVGDSVAFRGSAPDTEVVYSLQSLSDWLASLWVSVWFG